MADPLELDEGDPPPRKSDNAEVLKRVEEVLRIRLDGAQYHDVLQYASEKAWGVSDRQVSTYIARADELLVERQEKSRKRLIARRMAQRETLYAQAVKAADFRTALAVLDSADKLRGLFPEKDLKELARLVAAQAARIEDLERRLRDANTGPTPPQAPAAAVPTIGPTGGADTGGLGADRPVSGGPVPADA